MKQVIYLTLIVFFTGCGVDQLKMDQVFNSTKKVEQEDKIEEVEKTVSYQEIITKINDINTKKKNNKRIKEIVKEYQYNVSDDDSKNSAREKALNQVKVIILEEIGVFVESYLELNKIVTDEKYHKQFKQEIKNLTAGIIKTKILDEKYNGKQYYVKASVLVDPDSVSEGISEILKIKANQSEIKKLNALLKSKENEIDMRSQETIALQKKITSQEFLNRAKESELKIIRAELNRANLLLSKYQAEENRIRTRLDEIKSTIQKSTNKAYNIIRGMTVSEMREVAGYERSSSYGYAGTGKVYNYGNVWVQIEDGVVGCIVRSGCNRTKCSFYGKNSAYPPYSCVVK